MYIKKLLLASAIGLCTANVVRADETPQSDITHDVIGYEQSAYGQTKGYVATKSATGSKMDIDITEIPQSVSVVTKNMMETRNVQTIQNVTAYNASISQPYGENSDIRSNYGKIRGISYLYRSTFLDGTKLLHSGHLTPNYDPYGLEKVEILKGPASFLYGASEPGGLLNLQSKRPNTNEEKEVGISYGSYKNRSIFTDINHTINNKAAVRLTGKFKEGDNELKDSTNKSYFFNPSLTYFISDDTTLDINASIAKQQTKGLGLSFSGAKGNLDYHNGIASNAEGIAAAFGRGATYITQLQNSAEEVNALNLPSDLLIGLPNKEIFEKEHQAIGATLSTSLSENIAYRTSFRAMRQEGIMYYSQPSSSGLQGLLFGLTPDLTQLPMEFIQIDSKMNTLTWDNNLEIQSQSEHIKNTSLLGFDLQYSEYDREETNPSSYTYDLRNRTASNPASSTLRQDYTTKVFQAGVYAINNMKIYDKVVLNTALRFDRLKDKNSDHLNSKVTTQWDDNLSGRLGLTYLMDNGLAPYVSYSTSFSPNIGSDPDGNQFKPSVGKQVEVGLKYKPKSFSALFTFAAFKIEEQDILSTNSSNQKVQEGDAQVKGLEFDIVTQPTDNLSLIFSVARLSGKQVNLATPDYEGRAIDGLPKLTASIWTDYTFRKTTIGDLKLGAGIKYIGESKNIATDYFDFANGRPEKEYTVDDYTLVDAMIGTRYNNWDLSFNIYNLFDKNAELDNQSVRVAETAGRSFLLTAKYKF
jgi:iron complex outermembrane receptor protein